MFKTNTDKVYIFLNYFFLISRSKVDFNQSCSTWSWRYLVLSTQRVILNNAHFFVSIFLVLFFNILLTILINSGKLNILKNKVEICEQIIA